MTTAPAGVVPGARRVRVVVERADAPRCAISVGDYFEVDGSLLSTPTGPFCPYAMAAVFPVLALRQGDLPADDWLARKPFICCPDATENVVMRLVGVDDAADAADAADGGAAVTPAVRCTVVDMNYSACGMRVGDHFDVGPDGLVVPEGRPFCWFAIASVIPLINGRFGDDEWLDTHPLVACPDPPEALHMRLERVSDPADPATSS